MIKDEDRYFLNALAKYEDDCVRLYLESLMEEEEDEYLREDVEDYVC